jgi:hypothetical protein
MPPLNLLMPVIGTLIDRLFPDSSKADEAKLELAKMQISGELANVAGQLEINKAEAQNPSIFVAGARPFILWVCGLAVCYQFLIFPFITWYAVVNAIPAPPAIMTDDLWVLLSLLLGLGSMRSLEKVKGVARR